MTKDLNQEKWCTYCEKDTHDDIECWSTRAVPSNEEVLAWLKSEGKRQRDGRYFGASMSLEHALQWSAEADARRYRYMRDVLLTQDDECKGTWFIRSFHFDIEHEYARRQLDSFIDRLLTGEEKD